MQSHRDLYDFGTLFSTATALASPRCPSVDPTHLHARVPALGRRPGRRQILRQAFDALLTWHERMRQRRALADLSDYMLRDIGLSRADVSMEIDKPFWRP